MHAGARQSSEKTVGPRIGMHEVLARFNYLEAEWQDSLGTKVGYGWPLLLSCWLYCASYRLVISSKKLTSAQCFSFLPHRRADESRRALRGTRHPVAGRDRVSTKTHG